MFGRKQGRGKFSMFTFTYRHKLPFDLAKLGQQVTENVYFVGIYTVFWNDILQRANATNKSLQDQFEHSCRITGQSEGFHFIQARFLRRLQKAR